MKNFDKLKKRIEKLKDKDKSLEFCEVCGEPSRGKICKMCALIKG